MSGGAHSGESASRSDNAASPNDRTTRSDAGAEKRRAKAGGPARTRIPLLAFGLALAAATVGLGFDWPDPAMGTGAGLILFAIGAWATGALSAHLTALIFFCAAMLLDAAPADVVFSGFHSPALWLVFTGLVLGQSIVRTGLGARLADWMSQRLNAGYPGLLTGVVASGMALGFVIPTSMGRMAFLIPMALALADAFGFAKDSRGRVGLALAAAFGSHVTNFGVLTANVVNVILSGFADALFDIQIYYNAFLLTHYPVLGLAKAVAVIVVALFLFPDDRPRRAAGAAPGEKMPAAGEKARPGRGAAGPKSGPKGGPLSAPERALLIILLLALGLWMTDSLHRIPPAWVGLGAALLCLLPGIGPLAEEKAFASLDMKPLFFVAGVISVGALAAHSGMGTLLSELLRDLLPLRPGADLTNFATLAVTASAASLFTTLPGAPAVLAPLAPEMARLTGFPIEAVLMTQMVGFAMAPFPYQAPPIMLALSLAGIPLRVAIRFSLALAAIHLLILIPLEFYWWRLIGML